MGRNAKHFANLFMRTVFQNRKTENHAVTLRQTVNNTAQFIPRKWLFLIFRLFGFNHRRLFRDRHQDILSLSLEVLKSQILHY